MLRRFFHIDTFSQGGLGFTSFKETLDVSAAVPSNFLGSEYHAKAQGCIFGVIESGSHCSSSRIQ